MADLEKAIALAVAAHAGQKDKAGKPYILHPLRVMHRCTNETEQMVAVLHDVLEDTDITGADLRRQGIPDEVIRAVECLTKREGEAYEAFISRVSTDRLARRVKIADLLENLDGSRLASFGEHDAARMARYVAALARLRAEENL
ncbi:HD domain-containing protein [Pseudoduganella lutea]|uniref:HD domain-containing protein n=1 Tax=Pseudoduganella lutea TaxID=321985 RepID=A0A4P6L3C5_9BURK|nr:HD domain-containing protein [Pseudoduganella lutea]QBE65959.1 HD domain-containing protein [Pseudoduganella lutea]